MHTSKYYFIKLFNTSIIYITRITNIIVEEIEIYHKKIKIKILNITCIIICLKISHVYDIELYTHDFNKINYYYYKIIHIFTYIMNIFIKSIEPYSRKYI